jgi:S1-C subfamily serine protease
MTSTSSETSILGAFSDALVSMVKRVSQSVVQVRSGRGVGSGVVWDRSGLIATNAHVLGRSGKFEIGFSDGESLSAKLVGQDRFSDLALLQINGTKKDLTPIERGDSDSLAVGQFVVGLANPFGDNVNASSGIVTNPKGRIGGPWIDGLVITDVRLNRGYSGGPLVDTSGRMVGMNSAVAANRGIAIPVSVISTTISEIASHGSSKRAYLGIISNPIALPEDVSGDIGQSSGLIVLSVEPGTPAKKAGVAIGDILVKLDSRRIASFQDLHKALTGDLIEKETTLSVLRGEKVTNLRITPTEA